MLQSRCIGRARPVCSTRRARVASTRISTTPSLQASTLAPRLTFSSSINMKFSQSPFSGSLVHTSKRFAFDIRRLGQNPFEKEEEAQKKKPTPMELINSIPPIAVKGLNAACDGGGGPLGHPKIFIRLEKTTIDNPNVCGYCGLRFVSADAVMEALKSGRDLQQRRDFILPHQFSEYNVEEEK